MSIVYEVCDEVCTMQIACEGQYAITSYLGE